MRTVLRRVVLAAFFTVTREARAQHTTTNWCGSTDTYARSIREYVKHLVSSADSADVADRTLYKLQTASETDVDLVTDNAVCQQAASALALQKDSSGATPPVPVYVVRAGTSRFVVWRADDETGASATSNVSEFTYFYIFDSRFTRLSGFAS